MTQNLQQERAIFAWDCIEKVAKHDDDFCKSYASRVRGLPSMILGDGLALSLAFLKAKGQKDKAYQELYQQIAGWSKKTVRAQDDIVGWLINQQMVTYRHATSETLALLVWLKRFVEAKGWTDDAAGDE